MDTDIHYGLNENLSGKPILFSIGHRCTSASLIKELHMKFASYPFDWVVSKLDVILHCLSDNFKEYMQVTNYQGMNSETFNLCDNEKIHICHENIVFNEYYEQLFNNHNEKGTYGMMLAETHHDMRNEKDQGYFQRCVDRFKEMITIPRQKAYLYVHSLMGKNEFDIQSAELISKFIHFVDTFKTYAKQSYGIFFFAVKDHDRKNQVETVLQNEDMVIFVIYTNNDLLDAGGVYSGDFYNEQYTILITIEKVLKELSMT